MTNNWQRFMPVGLCLVGYFMFSCSDALRKYYAADMGLFDTLFWTNVISFGLLLLIAPKLGGLRDTVISSRWKMHLIRGSICAACFLCALYTFVTLPLVDAYTVIFMSPFIVCVLSVLFMGERMNAVRGAVLVLGFLGVLVAMRPDFTNLNLGLVAAFLLAVGHSIGLVTIKALEKTETKLSLVFYPVAGSMILGLIVNGGDVHLPNATQLACYAALSFLSLGGMLLISKAYTMEAAGFLSLTHYSQLIWGGIFGFVFFANVPGVLVFVGSAMVVGSGLVLVFENRIMAWGAARLQSRRLERA